RTDLYPVDSLSLVYIPSFFFFRDPAPTEIYTLSLHDALPILISAVVIAPGDVELDDDHVRIRGRRRDDQAPHGANPALSAEALRSEEHTSELQSLRHLVCRLLLEKKKKKKQRDEQQLNTSATL